jgi:hypothetical protein
LIVKIALSILNASMGDFRGQPVPTAELQSLFILGMREFNPSFQYVEQKKFIAADTKQMPYHCSSVE